MTVSYEKFMIDQELIARVKRIAKGVKVDRKKLISQEVENAGIGGSFLMHSATLEGCRKRWIPSVSDWLPYEQWIENGSENALQKASTQFKQIIEEAPESILDSAIDHELLEFIKSANA